MLPAECPTEGLDFQFSKEVRGISGGHWKPSSPAGRTNDSQVPSVIRSEGQHAAIRSGGYLSGQSEIHICWEDCTRRGWRNCLFFEQLHVWFQGLATFEDFHGCHSTVVRSVENSYEKVNRNSICETRFQILKCSYQMWGTAIRL